MKKETIKKLDMLQTFLASIFGIIVIYMGLIIFGLPTAAVLIKILLMIPELEVPYSFFGYIFMFWLGATLFTVVVKLGLWAIENLGSKDKDEDKKVCSYCEEHYNE